MPDRRVNNVVRFFSRRITARSIGDGEDTPVVGEDPASRVEDAAALGDQDLGAPLTVVDLRLQRVALNGLQEPQASADRAEEDDRDESERAKPGRAFVNCHGPIVLSRECRECGSASRLIEREPSMSSS